jgi:hypothetical protein
VSAKDRAGLPPHESREFAGGVRGAHGRACCRRRDRPQDGDDLRTEAVAEESRVGVGGVFSPRNLGEAAEFFAVGTRDAQHRTDDEHLADETPGTQTGPTFGARAAEEAHEQGFEGVVGVVRGGDDACAHARGHLDQSFIAGAPGVGLGVAWERTHPDVSDQRPHPQFARKLPHGLGVGVGLHA